MGYFCQRCGRRCDCILYNNKLKILKKNFFPVLDFIIFFRYEHRASLLRHVRHECQKSKSRGYYCPECNKEFSYGFLVSRHLLSVHKISMSKAKKAKTKIKNLC